MNNPRISIITITYNSERTLEETMLSVLSQDYDNLEYIIVDGCSTDHTLEIVEKYRDRVSIFISEPDKGISDAFNKGIRLATGDIIGIINSDDLLLPGALNTLALNFDAEIDVYRGHTVTWNPITGEKWSSTPSMSFPIKRHIKRICHQSTFVTKRAYDKFGAYRVDFKYMMDADLLYRFHAKGALFKYIPEDLAVSRIGGITTLTSPLKKIREEKLLITNNGGSIVLAYKNVCRFLIKESVKRVAFSIIGEKSTRRLKRKLSL